jgi:hypothetical protein
MNPESARFDNFEIPGSRYRAPRNDSSAVIQVPAFSALSISTFSTVSIFSGVTGPTIL